MKFITTILLSLLLFVVTTPAFAQDPGWPRKMSKNGHALVIYQPQVDDWKNFSELDWRMAVSLTPKGEKPVVGVIVLQGETLVNKESQIVTITNLKVVETRFPALDSKQSARMDSMARTFLPASVDISMQRLVACVPKKNPPPAVKLKNDPPKIFVSYKPAILLDVDGEPVRAKIEKTNLEYVVNTHWPLFYEPQGAKFYLLVQKLWLSAPELKGPWVAEKTLPKEMSKLTSEPKWAALKGTIPPKPDNVVPVVYYSTAPAVVLLFDGKPVFTKIPGNQLQYATNTLNYVFLWTPSKQYYILTSGRWFRSDSLDGPWTFATPELPADFAKIPRDNPAAQVLASVPGTEEAEDAVLMANIPTTATVNPVTAAAAAKVTYDGEPKFVPIEETTLYYATNTAQKVIRVGDLYYLCLQGIWFVSTTPQGPWQTAPSVPTVIYTIPPSSPVYNVTYVTQTTMSDGTVITSYTSGYTGVYVMSVSSGVVITSGTGYYYPPYIVVYPAYPYYPIYYPPPYTYGSVSYHYSSTGAYGVSQTAYGPYGTATRAAAYNPYTGTSARAASVSTAAGSAMVGQAYNPYTGAYGATRQGSNEYSSWGNSVVTKGDRSAYAQHQTTAEGTVGSIKGSEGGKAYGKSTESGNTVVAKGSDGDMYAGHDGNVYKNTGEGWEKQQEDGSWSTVESTPKAKTQESGVTRESAQQQAQASGKSRESAQQQAQASGKSRESAQQQASKRDLAVPQARESNQTQRLEQEARNRQRGEQTSQRAQNFQRSGGGGGRARGR